MLIDSSHWFIQMTDPTLPPTTFSHEYFLYGDTVVLSINYKKIYYRPVNNSFDYNTFTNPFSLYALLREDTINKRVYSIMLQNLASLCLMNQEILLYDFNLQLGDSLKPQDLCLFMVKRVVASIDSNSWLPIGKEYTLSSIDMLYEGVGSNHGLFEFIGETIGPYPYFLIDYCRGGLSNCGFITSVNEKENEASRFEVYPNPTNNLTTINLKKTYANIVVLLINISGQEVFNVDFKNQQLIKINTQQLVNGIYFLQIKTDKNNTVFKILKTN